MAEIREIQESPIKQGADEELTYSINTAPWGSSPSTITVKAYDVTKGEYTDVSSTILSGNATAVGDVISLPVIKSLTAGKKYRVEVKFTSGGNVFECWFIVWGER